MKSVINKFNSVFDTDIKEKSRKRSVSWVRHIYIIHCHDVLKMTYKASAESIGFEEKNAWWSKFTFGELSKRSDFKLFLQKYESKILNQIKK